MSFQTSLSESTLNLSTPDLETVPTNNSLWGVRYNVQWILHITGKIQNAIVKFDMPQSIEDFSVFKNHINAEIVAMSESDLEGESDNFREAFIYSDKSHFSGELEKQNKLQELILRKQSLYYHFISEAFKMSYLPFLNQSDAETLTSILDSGVLQYFNRLYLIYQKSLGDQTNKKYIENNKGENPRYAGLKDGELVAYKDLLRPEYFIRPQFFGRIPNKCIHDYFTGFYKLLQEGVTNYDDWLQLESNSLRLWNDMESKLGFVTLMEDYLTKGVLIDPELLFYFKTPEIETKKDGIELSKKFFNGEDYGIERTYPSNAEDVLSGGEGAFKVILGKNFPNDTDVKEKQGGYTYAIASRLGKSLLEKNAADCNKFIDVPSIDQDSFAKNTLEHVYYHEYGHNIYGGDPHKSLFEETKPDLFYYLYIYDQCTDNESSEKCIKDILDFMTVSFLRKNKFEGVQGLEKYTISQRLIYRELINVGLISWDNNNRISYNLDVQLFTKFLENLKGHLFFIKDLYEMQDDAGREKLESGFIEKLKNDTNEDFDKIADILRPEKN